jgi:penicillin-binding protein 2
METRLRVLSVIGAIFFLLIIIRLVQFQVVQGARYFRLAERNRIRQSVISAPRGRIFDRNGILIATTRPAFSLSVIPAEVDSTSIERLSSIAGIAFNEVWQRVLEAQRGTALGRLPIKIKRDITLDLVAKIEESLNDISALPQVVSIETEPIRYYPLADTFSHVIGYVNEIQEEELKRDTSYNPSSCVGRSGIEAQYEKYLRGYDGIKFSEVDSRGKEVGPIYEKRPIKAQAGKDLYLTLDAELQRHAYKILNKYKQAAIVGIDLSDGGIICFISKPSFDPNILLGPLPKEKWHKLINDPGKPFFNRVTMSGYPPGSTFKPCVALAGLEKRLLNKNSYFETCTGEYHFGNRIFKCWTSHGKLNLIDAISQSCNIYFYQTGLKLGLDVITQNALKCGFANLTGIDFPEENTGLIPTRQYLDQRYGKNRWSKGILLNLGIGQGEILVTPLQLANFYAMIAGNGEFFTPHLLKNPKPENRNPKKAKISPQNFSIIKEALFYAVERGTGAQAKVEAVVIAGKTGTAQNPFGEDHAWFVGYGGNSEPKVLFCIIVENAGKGGAVSAPIARELFRHYFQLTDTTDLRLNQDTVRELIDN